jgi:hypothetical protein
VKRESQLVLAATASAAVLFIFVHPAVLVFPAPPSQTLVVLLPIVMALVGFISLLMVPFSLERTSHDPGATSDTSLLRTLICSLLC